MDKTILTTPVLFIMYNRPDLTFKVFEEIRKVRPQTLYLAADGPKEMNKTDAYLCGQARSVINLIDWDCSVVTKFQKHNKGCRNHVSESINWLFENEEEGIILEDDCLPGSSFFHFCSEMLEKYRYDFSVGHISGNNFLNDNLRCKSYIFSKYAFIWGWATWRRSWKFYDVNVSSLPQTIINDSLNHIFNSIVEKNNFYNKFLQVYTKTKDTWDYQWLYAIWHNNLKSIIPPVNLIKNIGFDQRATHTVKRSRVTDLKLDKIHKIVHPLSDQISYSIDSFFYNKVFKRHKVVNLYLFIKLIYIRFKYDGWNIKKSFATKDLQVAGRQLLQQF